MRDAAADLDFEKAARLRDEIKRLKAVELASMDDPIARQEAKSQERGGKSGARANRGSISPLEGEMSAKAEGGNPPSDSAAIPPSTPLGASPPQGGRSGEQASYFAKPSLDDMGPGTDTARPLFRRNTLDEMTVGRTEKPVTGKVPEKPADAAKRVSPLLEGQPERDDPRPVIRGKVGVGSYEDPAEQKRKGRTKGKTGRPGR